MKTMNPAVRNILVFLLLLLIVGLLFWYLRHGRTMHKGISENIMKNMKASASDDYRKYFGEVPDAGMIKCEGLVIYYPSIKGDSFLPYPFFVTTPDKKEELIAKSMLAGLPMRAMADFVVPIFRGLGEFEGIEIRGGTLNLFIKTFVEMNEEDLADTARSFLLTYSQFDGRIEEVIVHAGNDVKFKFPARDLSVEEPGPPVILDAFLVREEGAKDPHELRIMFDRPVMIKDIEIVKADGEKMAGKVYLAEFSMAGIFVPEGTAGLIEGEGFKVMYSVHDYRKRRGEGEKSFTARVEIHSG